MIFVSVGTHHQPFDRLLRAVGTLADALDEEIVVQQGVSVVPLPGCRAVPFMTPSEVRTAMSEARAVVLHGGSSSFLEARGLGRMPIVVPRRAALGEHVDDHQVRFAAHLHEAGAAVVCAPGDLATVLRGWRETRAPPGGHLEAFAIGLGALIEQLVEPRG